MIQHSNMMTHICCLLLLVTGAALTSADAEEKTSKPPNLVGALMNNVLKNVLGDYSDMFATLLDPHGPFAKLLTLENLQMLIEFIAPIMNLKETVGDIFNSGNLLNLLPTLLDPNGPFSTFLTVKNLEKAWSLATSLLGPDGLLGSLLTTENIQILLDSTFNPNGPIGKYINKENVEKLIKLLESVIDPNGSYAFFVSDGVKSGLRKIGDDPAGTIGAIFTADTLQKLGTSILSDPNGRFKAVLGGLTGDIGSTILNSFKNPAMRSMMSAFGHFVQSPGMGLKSLVGGLTSMFPPVRTRDYCKNPPYGPFSLQVYKARLHKHYSMMKSL